VRPQELPHGSFLAITSTVVPQQSLGDIGPAFATGSHSFCLARGRAAQHGTIRAVGVIDELGPPPAAQRFGALHLE
jgi:hypothetical protein